MCDLKMESNLKKQCVHKLQVWVIVFLIKGLNRTTMPHYTYGLC